MDTHSSAVSVTFSDRKRNLKRYILLRKQALCAQEKLEAVLRIIHKRYYIYIYYTIKPTIYANTQFS